MLELVISGPGLASHKVEWLRAPPNADHDCRRNLPQFEASKLRIKAPPDDRGNLQQVSVFEGQLVRRAPSANNCTLAGNAAATVPRS